MTNYRWVDISLPSQTESNPHPFRYGPTIMTTTLRTLATLLLTAASLALFASPAQVSAQGKSLDLPDTKIRPIGGDDVSLTSQLAGHATLLVLSFERDQLDDLKSWMSVDRELCASNPGLRRLSIPVLPSGARFLRRLIDGGMADSVGAEKGCGQTATAYIKKAPLLEALSIKDETNVVSLLVSAEGTVIWRGQGAATPQAIDEVRSLLEGADNSTAGL
ncbi:MAG: hypothetical protein CMP23_05585 [Rickettsiales bacterium]|nr:hypothetical protein [Rickettsiales bacterium]